MIVAAEVDYACPITRLALRLLALIWADMLSAGLPKREGLALRPANPTGLHSRRFRPVPVNRDFRFPVRRRGAYSI